MKQIFYEGDKVKHPEFGEGVVESIKFNVAFPVCVKFGNKPRQCFKADGRFASSEFPTLTFLDGTQFDYGTPPKRKWIPAEAHWAKVYGSPYVPHISSKVFIVNYDPSNAFPYKDLSGVIWKHAEPCDPPEWEGDRE